MPLGSSHSKKKEKKVKFHKGGGGGSGQNWVIFTLFLFFFFHVLNHANLQRKYFLVWGGGYPLDTLGKNLVILNKFSRYQNERNN